MAAIPESVRALVAEGHLAHLVTVNADGSAQVSVVWMGLDGDELVPDTSTSESRSGTCVATRAQWYRWSPKSLSPAGSSAISSHSAPAASPKAALPNFSKLSRTSIWAQRCDSRPSMTHRLASSCASASTAWAGWDRGRCRAPIALEETL
jgi:Pyridoxamine 5'-phosphate oxidase